MLQDPASAPPAIIPDFAELFQRYTRRTDGKRLLAEALLPFCRAGGTLLDLGAGDGALTSLLAPHFGRIVAVEKNEKFQQQLSRIQNAAVIAGSMENSLLDLHFDTALLSYSLTGVPQERVGRFLADLMGRRGPEGRVLFATFQDGCDWDAFVTPIYRELGRARSGGVGNHIALVEGAGFRARRLAQVETELFDSSVPELATTLGFFFAPLQAQYFSKRESYCAALSEYVRPSRNHGVALGCTEEIWEILER